MSEPRSPSLESRQLQSLCDYANLVDKSSSERNGFTFARADTDRLRDLADRVSTHLTTGAGVFTEHDVVLLAGAGEPLMNRATQTLALPGIVEAERPNARSMASVGTDILAVRDYVRVHIHPAER